jgi:hypothetical protein
MATKIDESALTSFIPIAVNEAKDLIRTKMFENKAFINDVTLVSGINHDTEVGYLNELGDIGVKASTTKCGINEIEVVATTDKKTWVPKSFDSRIVICLDEMLNSIMSKTFKKGTDATNPEGTVFEDIFMELLDRELIRMQNRFIYLCELNAAKYNDSPAGDFGAFLEGNVAKGALNINLVNIQDSLFKKATAVIAASPDQGIDLSFANGEATYAAQNAAMTPALAYDAANKFYYNAPLNTISAFGEQGAYVECTLAFFRKLQQYFQGKELESLLTNLENGKQQITVNGINFVSNPSIDWLIQRFQNTGTKLINPFRAMLRAKKNILFGVPDAANWGYFNAFYENKDRKFYIDIKDKFDIHFLHNADVMLAV